MAEVAVRIASGEVRPDSVVSGPLVKFNNWPSQLGEKGEKDADL